MSESEQLLSNSNDGSKISIYTWRDNGSISTKHCIWLPRSLRAIIVGKSGFGKTTLLTILLLEPDVIDYKKLMVCRKSLHHPEYYPETLKYQVDIWRGIVCLMGR